MAYSNKPLIYLDYAATTPLDPRVLEAMHPYLVTQYGNPSSVHQLGRQARFAVEEAREKVAALLGAEPSEIIFTSGATEANNLALKGAMACLPGKTLITSQVEHKAVLKPAQRLQKQGYSVTFLSPDRYGQIPVDTLQRALQERTGLVSLMMVNNELGTYNPIQEMASVCREQGVLFHTDAVQAVAYLPVNVAILGVDMLSLSAHKIYGPKGVGVLYVRGGVEILPQIEGGAQERNRRAGTEHVSGIVGMAKALELAVQEREERAQHVRMLRQQLYEALREALGERFVLNTPLEHSAPHILHVAFPPIDDQPVDGEMLLLNMDLEGICVSSGSACTSGAIEPSHVLQAIGLKPEVAGAAIRFSLGKETTRQEITYVVERLAHILPRMTTWV